MENTSGKQGGFYSRKLKAGKRRTYFFDVRSTKQGDYFVSITESKKKNDGDGYESHKVFLYKEDFNKFIEALNDTINHVKTEMLPDFDFDAEREYKSAEKNSIEEPNFDDFSSGETSSKTNEDEDLSWG